ncbi:sensor histidine kinase [Nibrella viscosa]
MSFQIWDAAISGMISSILLLNVVQWITFRGRIYALYTFYMLAWLAYFSLRIPEIKDWFSSETYYFVRGIGAVAAYFFYFDFSDILLNLKRRLPHLVRLFTYTKVLIVAYIAYQFTFCYLLPEFDRYAYETAYTFIRLYMLTFGVYGIYQLMGLRSPASHYLVTGTSLLLVGGLISMALAFLRPEGGPLRPFWESSIAYMQMGVILELICFSVALGFRQRRSAIRNAVMEQDLAREREKRQREHLESELAVQQLKQQMSEVQMRALQAQLNPHFLFNSLNSLSSLIADEPQKAEVFVDEMATVYRYLLQNNEAGLTNLSRELGFINSFYHLLKTRYGRGVDLTISVDEKYLSYRLPPLTLQLLVENAVKHNIVSADQPLNIEICTDVKGWLVVCNNLQRKPSGQVKSTGKGLLHIMTKYQMLNQPEPVVQDTDGNFMVVLPLLEPEKKSAPAAS